MREVLGRAVVLVAACAAALLLTPATAVAQCTGGLGNTLGGPGGDGCGGSYPAAAARMPEGRTTVGDPIDVATGELAESGSTRKIRNLAKHRAGSRTLGTS